MRTHALLPFGRWQAQLTVGHLRKYLGRKMGLGETALVEIFCRDQVHVGRHGTGMRLAWRKARRGALCG